MTTSRYIRARWIGLCLGGLFSLSVSATHHIDCTDPANAGQAECAGVIDCNDPINLIYPQCANGGGVSQNCMSLFSPMESQLTLTWVNLMNGDSVANCYANVRMRLLPTLDGSVQFQVTEATPSQLGAAPSDGDCVARYSPASGQVSVPAVRTSLDASEPSYRNVLMNLESAAGLVFKVISVETR
jgi:hypothetical protein